MNSCQAANFSPWVAAAVGATALGALVFVVLYATTTHGAWRRTSIGRNVMVLTAVILVVSLLAVSTIVFGVSWPYRDIVRAGAWWAVAGTLWWRVTILLRVQRRKG